MLVTASGFAFEGQDRILLFAEDVTDWVELREMIPICASCKKIRDDKGYWNQIEGFIKDHSDAEFSHSLCPECVNTCYPDCVTEDK